MNKAMFRSKPTKVDGNRTVALKYIMIAVTILFYTICIDIRSGFPILIIYLVFPLVSYLTVSRIIKKLRISVDADKTVFNKSEKVTVNITVESESILPVPLIYVELLDSGKLSGGGDFVLSLIKGGNGTVKREYTASYSGPVEIGIKNIRVYDCLGIFSRKLQASRGYKDWVYTVGIIPDIPHVPDNEMLNESMNVTQNDSEDEIETNLFSHNKLPGYEHREYSPGDPIKLINWKLSGKYDKYYVRNQESLASSKQAIVLDIYSSAVSDVCVYEERAVEAALSMLFAMLRHGISCTVFYFKDRWLKVNIEKEEDLAHMCENLASYSFIPYIERTGKEGGAQRIPVNEISTLGLNSFLLFTPSFDSQLSEMVEKLQDGVFYIGVGAASAEGIPSKNVWLIAPNYDYIRMKIY